MHARLWLIVSRIAQALPALIGVVVVSFLLTRALPGDPAAYFAGAAATAESIAQVRATLGLDQPLPAQFLSYVGDLLTGNLGQSLSTGQPVLDELTRRLPASLELTLSALLLSCLIAIPLGILAATRQGTYWDHLCRAIVTAGVSLPTFFTGIVLVYVFYYLLGWAPSPIGRLDFLYLSPPEVTGFYVIDALLAGDLETAGGAARQLILPAATLALFTLGGDVASLVGRLRAHRARRRPEPLQDRLRLRLSQCHVVGCHHLVDGVFVHPGGQCAR